MATLIDWSQVESKVHLYASLYDCDTDSTALAHVAIEHLLALTPEEIEEAITDGTQDRGVDAVVVKAEGKKHVIHLFQVKYVTTFDKTENNFPSNEIDKLLSFISDVLEHRAGMQKTCNPILWAKVQEIWELFATGSGTPSFIVHLVGNMAPLVSTEATRLTSSLAKYRIFEVREHTLESLAQTLIESKTPRIDRNLRLVDNQYFERIDGNIRGLVATVQASDLVEMIRNPNNPSDVLLDMFDDNVRIYLTRSNRINAMIYESARSDSNAEFWYLNNGITLTCDSMSYPPGMRAPRLDMCNVQIVNGGQTSNALFEAAKDHPEKVKNVLVLIRVYETKEREISLRIAESTNSQTPIRSRDLRANDAIQRKLASAFTDRGLFYERKARQYKDEEKSRRIDAQTAGQAYVAYFLDLPEVAGKDRGRIFGDLYETIFNEDEITAERLLVPLQLFDAIEKLKRKLQRNVRQGADYDPKMLFLIDGSYHLLYATATLCELRGIDRMNVPEAKKQVADAIDVVVGAVEHEQRNDLAYAHKRFFKSVRARKLIERFAAKIAKQENLI